MHAEAARGMGNGWDTCARACHNTNLRAYPDLNQGPADLQSAALTTELYTHAVRSPLRKMDMRNDMWVSSGPAETSPSALIAQLVRAYGQ